MAGLNRATLLGNLGQHPAVRQTKSGSPVANLRLATNEKWRDRTTGEMRTSTEWHNVVAFSSIAEMVDRFLSKGSMLFIEGRLQTRKWQDRSGADRYTSEIIAQNIQILESGQRATREEQAESSGEVHESTPDLSDCPF